MKKMTPDSALKIVPQKSQQGAVSDRLKVLSRLRVASCYQAHNNVYVTKLTRCQTGGKLGFFTDRNSFELESGCIVTFVSFHYN